MTRIRNDSRLGTLLKVTTQRSVTECATQCSADTRFSRPGRVVYRKYFTTTRLSFSTCASPRIPAARRRRIRNATCEARRI